MRTTFFHRLALIASLLALGVVVLGAYVRLSHAGLGCPDWPTCYGHLTVTQAERHIGQIDKAYPHRPLQAPKAWKEMIHRYFAGTLGVLVLALAVLALARRKQPGQPVALPLFLLVLIIFQALLGMWTVTLLLTPLVVMSHLLGGLTTLALLWWLALRTGDYSTPTAAPAVDGLRGWALLGLIILVCQIALGGWTSANYAALACGPDFPTCLGQWWPPMHFAAGFSLIHTSGIDYQGGVLSNSARAAIQMTHRIGALITFLYLGGLALKVTLSTRPPAQRVVGLMVGLLLIVQVLLGIGNVVLGLPMVVAVAHNGVAALLLLAVVTLNHLLWPPRRLRKAQARAM